MTLEMPSLQTILFIKCKEGAREAIASPSVMPPKYNLNYHFVGCIATLQNVKRLKQEA